MSSFTAQSNFEHGSEKKIGVLVCNLGTPNAPTPPAVRRYLAEFLSDKRVVELSRWLWKPILHGIILRLRPRRSAAAYKKIWTKEGSPLLAISERQVAALSKRLTAHDISRIEVALGMRYGEPSIASGLQKLRTNNVGKILILPLYPQYASATTGSVFDAVASEISHWRWVPALRFINEYHSDPRYLDALALSVKRYWQKHGRGEKLILSFHGIPEDTFLAGDPYFCHCQATGRELANRLQLDDDKWQLTFQSRVGTKKWLQPYTDKTLEKTAKLGIKNVDVLCPGFSADCLETLEEIAMQNAEIFTRAGGETLNYIEALNDQTEHISFLAEKVLENCSDWLDGPEQDEQARQAVKARAAEMKRSQFS